MEGAAVKNHSLFPLETCPHVPDEAFRQFHTIDRELYAALTRTLRRDPAESVQVVAFLMWLEKECVDSTLIKRISSLPPLLINAAADEAAACVRCVESDVFVAGDDGDGAKLLSELLSLPAGVSLRFLHDNRIAVLRGVSKIMNTVCWRALGDLFHGDRQNIFSGGGEVMPRPPPSPPMHLVYNTYSDMAGGVVRTTFVASAWGPPPYDDNGCDGAPAAACDSSGGFPGYDVAQQRLMVGQELGNLMSTNMNLNFTNAAVIENKEVEKEVSPDDRTIFLTFSKGYPTSEEEVRDYFTRKFGDFIEDLIMQDVEADEQPLYAKMVARSPAVIDGIVEGNKAKYSINGKHVWARKYVKKPPQQRSPPRGEASGSSPSPAKKA